MTNKRVSDLSDDTLLSVRIPKSTADWLRQRALATDVKTSQLVRRLLRMEIASVDDLESELESERKSPLEKVADALCLQPAFRPSVLISKVEKE